MSNSGNKNGPVYLRWQLWVVAAVCLILILAGTSVAFGPEAVARAIFDPASYVPLGIVCAGLAGVWLKVEEKLKEARQKAEEAAQKASVAEVSAQRVSDKADDNSTRSDRIEDAMKLFKLNQDSQQHYIDDLQQERENHKGEMADLKAQLREINKENQALQREITDLKIQLRELGRENVADKQEITLLRSRVATLEMEVAKLTVENSHLLEENRDLKIRGGVGVAGGGPGWIMGRKRVTGPLTGLHPPGMQQAYEEYITATTPRNRRADDNKQEQDQDPQEEEESSSNSHDA